MRGDRVWGRRNLPLVSPGVFWTGAKRLPAPCSERPFWRRACFQGYKVHRVPCGLVEPGVSTALSHAATDLPGMIGNREGKRLKRLQRFFCVRKPCLRIRCRADPAIERIRWALPPDATPRRQCPRSYPQTLNHVAQTTGATPALWTDLVKGYSDCWVMSCRDA